MNFEDLVLKVYIKIQKDTWNKYQYLWAPSVSFLLRQVNKALDEKGDFNYVAPKNISSEIENICKSNKLLIHVPTSVIDLAGTPLIIHSEPGQNIFFLEEFIKEGM